MDTQKATVTAVDALGRVVLLTERNEAVILKTTDGGLRAGDIVTINRDADKRRMSDWRIVP